MSANVIRIDNRLKLCGDFVRNGSTVADVGTDHAYLPVWLCQKHKAEKVIAADINEMPLAKGRQTIRNYRMEHCIETRLSDGLSAIGEEEVTDIVIAGMGGELIAEIIRNARWLKAEKYHLILQPMSRAHLLRKYLYQNGFSIQEEQCTSADRKLYTVMSVYYTGTIVPLTAIRLYCGKIDPKRSQEDYQYLIHTAAALQKKGRGILSADANSTDGRQCMNDADRILTYAENGGI